MEIILERLIAFQEETADNFRKVNERFDGLEAEVASLRQAVRSLERRFDIYTEDLLRLRGDVKNHEKGLEELEFKAS